MQKSTQELMHRLKEADDILTFLEENKHELLKENVQDFLGGLLVDKNLKAADVAHSSGQGDYVYKVFQGTRKASRKILLAISVGMSLSIPETQMLLRIAQVAQLDPRNRNDSIVIYALENCLTIQNTNDILYDLDETTL